VIVEGVSDEHEYVMMGRHRGQAPEIDGQVYLSEGEARPGELRRVQIVDASDYDLVGEILDEPALVAAPAPRPIKAGNGRVSLAVLR
jgi:ribosomal protein S12 methylthiotransferase